MHLPEPTGGSFELAPEGTHLAVCYRVIDMGTQKSVFNGETKVQRKVMVSWELPNERMEDNRPFTIHQSYTFSMHEKATLRKHLENWRGKKFADSDFGPEGFNMKKLLGVGCLLTVTHSTKGENTYANLAGVSKMMKDMTAPQPENAQVYFSMENAETFEVTRAAMEEMSDRLAERIKSSPEYIDLSSGAPAPSFEERGSYELDDEIPF